MKKKVLAFGKNQNQTYYVLFSKSGFTKAVKEEARKDDRIILVSLDEILKI